MFPHLIISTSSFTSSVFSVAGSSAWDGLYHQYPESPDTNHPVRDAFIFLKEDSNFLFNFVYNSRYTNCVTFGFHLNIQFWFLLVLFRDIVHQGDSRNIHGVRGYTRSTTRKILSLSSYMFTVECKKKRGLWTWRLNGSESIQMPSI